ncbi:MAG: hypothetical protein EOP25_05250 [Rhodococcus sp. (in: high G+C Gram-positive bacteria)]|nr:MAG: hypothetical protein EOP25_05250 [Rhodococcus sp. (in: high G+C Gram-positive bacteria)]
MRTRRARSSPRIPAPHCSACSTRVTPRAPKAGTGSGGSISRPPGPGARSTELDDAASRYPLVFEVR